MIYNLWKLRAKNGRVYRMVLGIPFLICICRNQKQAIRTVNKLCGVK